MFRVSESKYDKCMVLGFMYLTYHKVSWWFTSLSLAQGEIGRQLLKAPLAAARSPYSISHTHPTHARI